MRGSLRAVGQGVVMRQHLRDLGDCGGGAMPRATDPFSRLGLARRRRCALADLLDGVAVALPDGVRPAGAALVARLLRWSATAAAMPDTVALAPTLALALDGRPGDAELARALARHRRAADDTATLALDLAARLESRGAARLALLAPMLHTHAAVERAHAAWVEVALIAPARRRLGPLDTAALSLRLGELARPDGACAATLRALLDAAALQSPAAARNAVTDGMPTPRSPSNVITPSFARRVN